MDEPGSAFVIALSRARGPHPRAVAVERTPRRAILGVRRCAALLAAMLLAATLGASAARGAEPACSIPQARLLRTMQAERAKGYDLKSTANGVRLQAAVIVDLVAERRRTAPDGAPFWILHDDYFAAFLAATDLAPAEAPAFVSVAHEHGEDYRIEYRLERVIDEVVRGPTPDLAATVVAGWPAAPDTAEAYTFEDAAATPPLRVTHARLNSYRLLRFGDIIVYDDIDGLYGRATGGLLGLVFDVIGDGRAVQSRIVVADDGLQVTRTRARKGPLRVTQTATVLPDGTAERGVPRDRPDLERLEQRLQAPLEIDYVDLRLETMPEPPEARCTTG